MYMTRDSNKNMQYICLLCCFLLYSISKCESRFSFLFWYYVAIITMLSIGIVLALQVPQHYKLMGYHPVSTWEAFNSYIPSTLARPLRNAPVTIERLN